MGGGRGTAGGREGRGQAGTRGGLLPTRVGATRGIRLVAVPRRGDRENGRSQETGPQCHPLRFNPKRKREQNERPAFGRPTTTAACICPLTAPQGVLRDTCYQKVFLRKTPNNNHLEMETAGAARR